MKNLQETKFATAERVDSANIPISTELLLRSAVLDHLLETIPCILLILNEERQVVFGNRGLLDSVGIPSGATILGKRPGEILNCVHATQSPGGCGTTESCCHCGAFLSILQSQEKGRTIENECRIRTANGECYEFTVQASPYRLENSEFTIVSFLDISDHKRRHVLERTFFHDIFNILMPIVAYSELLANLDLSDDIRKYVDTIKNASKELAAEISSHKKLLQAENKKLAVELVDGVSSAALVQELIHVSANIWNDRRIVQGEQCDDFLITTDRTLLYRVLYNMVKNAAEACGPDEVVSISCFRDDASGVFSVHNPNFMPRYVQLQVFQRSFSTKGNGRGIGTYSMKLFGEQYLKGKVWFSTSEKEGTTFFISLPLSYEDV